jgi:hypothetical protein
MVKLVVLEVILVLLGGFFLFAYHVQNTRDAAQTEWSTTQGRVLRSQIATEAVRAHASDVHPRTLYTLEVVYRYEVDGRSFTGDRVSNDEPGETLDFGESREPSAALRGHLARYPQGATVTVHYDPADPARSVLELRGNSAKFGALAFAVLLLGAALLILLKPSILIGARP